jgi:single-strand DNA-binding protein
VLEVSLSKQQTVEPSTAKRERGDPYGNLRELATELADGLESRSRLRIAFRTPPPGGPRSRLIPDFSMPFEHWNKTMNEKFKNEAHVHGLIAKPPTVRYTGTGKCVTTLSIRTQYEKFSEYHRVVCWEALAEKAASRNQGDFVKIVGRLASRSWDDKQTGTKRYTTEIVAYVLTIPSEEQAAALTPDAIKGGTAIARAILRPSEKNIHGLEVSDADVPF